MLLFVKMRNHGLITKVWVAKLSPFFSVRATNVSIAIGLQGLKPITVVVSFHRLLLLLLLLYMNVYWAYHFTITFPTNGRYGWYNELGILHLTFLHSFLIFQHAYATIVFPVSGILFIYQNNSLSGFPVLLSVLHAPRGRGLRIWKGWGCLSSRLGV